MNLLDYTLTIAITANSQPLWRVRGTYEVMAALIRALSMRPGSHKLIYGFDVVVQTPHEVVTDKDEALRRIHAMIFEEHLRSIA